MDHQYILIRPLPPEMFHGKYLVVLRRTLRGRDPHDWALPLHPEEVGQLMGGN